MTKVLLPLTILMLARLFGGAALLPPPDAQGWTAPAGTLPVRRLPQRGEDVPIFVLFNGPYPLQNGCLEVYDRLYSPIGICQFLDIKPAALSGKPRSHP